MIPTLVVAALLLVTLLLAERGWSNVLSPVRNDLVFQGRNRAYGAYPLRRDHSRVLLLATMTAIGTIGAGLGIPKLFRGDGSVTRIQPPVVVEIDLDRIVIPPPKTKPALTNQVAHPVRQRKPDEVAVPVDSTVAPPDTTSHPSPVDPDTTSHKGDLPPDDSSATAQNSSGSNPDPTRWAEQMPEFPGGQEALQKWFGRNIQFDVDWINGRSAQVFVEFVIDGEGKVASATILRGADRRLDNAVLRAVRNMPDWIPGRQGGHPVSVRFAQPINFHVRP